MTWEGLPRAVAQPLLPDRLSRDRGTADQAQDQGYGPVTDLTGRLIPNLVMTGASQEHGTLTARDGADLPDLPVSTRLDTCRTTPAPPPRGSTATTSWPCCFAAVAQAWFGMCPAGC